MRLPHRLTTPKPESQTMTVPAHYDHFCTVISKGPATGHLETVTMVAALSGGQADPADVSRWWNQWQALRAALKNAHAPMVNVAKFLAPSDAPTVPLVPMMTPFDSGRQARQEQLLADMGKIPPSTDGIRDGSFSKDHVELLAVFLYKDPATPVDLLKKLFDREGVLWPGFNDAEVEMMRTAAKAEISRAQRQVPLAN